MEIQRYQNGPHSLLKLKGRLDARWAEHLEGAMDEMVRQGRYDIVLDAAGVTFMSSAGIRVLLVHFKRLRSIGGTLVLANPSTQVQNLLSMSGLKGLLEAELPPADTTGGGDAAVIDSFPFPSGGHWEAIRIGEAGSLHVRAVGRPNVLDETGGPWAVQSCPFPVSRFGLGLGAIDDGTDNRERIGEFLAVAGMAAVLPPGGGRPDYLIGAGDFVPRIAMAYGLILEGDFPWLIRFDAGETSRGVVGLSGLAATALDISGAEAAGILLIGEHAGLVGASLKKVPGQEDTGGFFAFPGVRRHLHFTTDPMFVAQTSVTMGIAVRRSIPFLEPFLRPLRDGQGLQGHFHALAMTYRPLPRDVRSPAPFLARLFKEERLLGLLHLLADDRPVVGAGESEWVRGGCWAAPLFEIQEGVGL